MDELQNNPSMDSRTPGLPVTPIIKPSFGDDVLNSMPESSPFARGFARSLQYSVSKNAVTTGTLSAIRNGVSISDIEEARKQTMAQMKQIQEERDGLAPRQVDSTGVEDARNRYEDFAGQAPKAPQLQQSRLTDMDQLAIAIGGLIGGFDKIPELTKGAVAGRQSRTNDDNRVALSQYEIEMDQHARGLQVLRSLMSSQGDQYEADARASTQQYGQEIASLDRREGDMRDELAGFDRAEIAQQRIDETNRKNLQGEFQKRVEAFIEQAENEGEVTDDEVKAYEALLASAGQSLDVTGLPKLKAGKTIKRQELDQRINNEAKKYNLDLKKFNQAVVQFEKEMKRKMTVLEMDQLYNDWKMDDGNRRTAISQQQADTSSQRAATAERNGQVYRNGDGTGMTKKQMQTAVDKLDVEIKGLRALQQQGDEDGKIESKIKQKAAERIAIQNKMNPLAIEPLDPLGVTGGIGELFDGGKLPATDPKFDKNAPKTKSVAKKPAPKSKGRFGTPK